MRGIEPENGLASRPIRAFAILAMTALAAAGLYGAARPVLQPTASETKCAGAATAQNPAANVPMTAAQGAAILRELRAIRMLLQNGAARAAIARRPAAAQPVKIRIKPGWPALGIARAPVTMVEFADLQCPFCRRFHTTTFPEIKKDYIDTGKVRFIARSNPLPMHAYALGAAEAAHCAGDQGKFWQFRDAVLDDQSTPTPDILLKHAGRLGLNLQEFRACLNGDKYRQLIAADRQEAVAVGIHGTPAFVIGRANGGWIEGVLIVGARPLPLFKRQIEAMLSAPPSASAKAHPAAGASAIRAAAAAGNR